jgi:hypothetical protein
MQILCFPRAPSLSPSLPSLVNITDHRTGGTGRSGERKGVVRAGMAEGSEAEVCSVQACAGQCALWVGW